MSVPTSPHDAFRPLTSTSTNSYLDEYPSIPTYPSHPNMRYDDHNDDTRRNLSWSPNNPNYHSYPLPYHHPQDQDDRPEHALPGGKQDRRRVQNRLAQRAFRARSKVTRKEVSLPTNPDDTFYHHSPKGTRADQVVSCVLDSLTALITSVYWY
jgi:hypothetical protein